MPFMFKSKRSILFPRSMSMSFKSSHCLPKKKNSTLFSILLTSESQLSNGELVLNYFWNTPCPIFQHTLIQFNIIWSNICNVCIYFTFQKFCVFPLTSLIHLKQHFSVWNTSHIIKTLATLKSKCFFINMCWLEPFISNHTL